MRVTWGARRYSNNQLASGMGTLSTVIAALYAIAYSRLRAQRRSPLVVHRR